MKKTAVKMLSALLMLSMVFSTSVFAANEQTTSAWDSFLGLFSAKASADEVGVEYRGHIETKGDFPLDGTWIQGPNELGTRGQFLRMEGFWIKLTDAPDGLNIKYNVHVQNEGWLFDEDDSTDWATNGDFCGTKAKMQRIEAVKIVLVDDEGNISTDYDVMYQGHVQDVGDLPKDGSWFENGEQLGTTGSSLRLEALKVKIVQKEADLTAYNAAKAAVAQADYTTASWTTYAAVVAANVVTEDNLQSEVDAATAAITAAQANLVKVLKVESVSAINAGQVVVTFTSPVTRASVLATPDATTSVIKTGVLSFAKVSGSGTSITTSTLGAVLSADGKTLTVTTPATEYFAGTYTATLTNLITGTDGQKLATYSTAFSVDDQTAPIIDSVTATTAGTTVSSLKIVFAEPVKAGSIIQVDGTTIGSTVAGTETTLNNLSIAAGTHTLTAINLTDYANNVTPNASKSFTSTVDVTLPTVTVGQYSDTSLLLTFSKKMDTTTLVGQSNVALTATDLTSYVVSVTADATDSTGTKFIAKITGNPAALSNLYLNSNTRNLVATFADGKIKDTLGNKLAGVTISTSLTKDTTAPSITGISYETDTDSKLTYIVLTFDQLLQAQNTLVKDSIKAIDASGVDQTAKFFANSVLATSIGNTIKVPVLAGTNEAGNLALANALVNGNYTFVVPKGFVKDDAKTPNDSNAYTGTIDFGTAKAGSLTVSLNSSTTNKYVLRYSVEPKGGNVTGSATLATNYLLNGNALPAGAVITKSGTDVTVDLTATSIPTSNAGSILTALNVQSADATKSLTTANVTVATTDNVKPVLQSAKLQSNTSILLTYDEDVTSTGTNVGDSFIFKADGALLTALDGTTAANLTVAAVPGFPKQVVVTAAAGAVPTATAPVYSRTTNGATVAVTATGYTPVVAKNYVIKVTTVDATPAVTGFVVSTDGGNTYGTTTYTTIGGAVTIDNGVSVNITAGTADAVGDTMSFTVTPVFDMNKTVTITTAEGTVKIKDLSALNNPMHTGDTVTVTQ